jgi:hypothetical protein
MLGKTLRRLIMHGRLTIIRPDGDTEQFGELTAAEPRPDVAVRLKGACTPLQLALASGPLFRRTLCRRRVGARPNRSPKWQYSRRGKLLPARRTLFQNYVVEQSEIVVSVVNP